MVAGAADAAWMRHWSIGATKSRRPATNASKPLADPVDSPAQDEKQKARLRKQAEKLSELTRALIQDQAAHAGKDAKIRELLTERAVKDAALRVKEEALAEESRRAETLGAALLQTQKKLTALQEQHNELQKQYAELLASKTLQDVELSLVQEKTGASTTQYEATLQEEHAKPPRKVCRFFGTAAGCRNGMECTFLHARPESPTKRRLTLTDNAGRPA